MSEKSTAQKTTLYLRIIWALLGLFFVITVASQIYIYLRNPYKTETAMIYNTSDEIKFKGIHVRDERLVQYGGVDVISYIHPDGSKIGRNSIVAQSYKTIDDILLQQRIAELTERVTILQNAEALSSTDNSQLESYINQITGRQIALLGQMTAGDYSGVGALKNEYISLQCSKLILRGDETNYAEQINALNNEISNLRARLSAQPRNVTIDEAGYFVSAVDGYEGFLSFERLSSLSKSEIEQIIREPQIGVADGVIGKMIDGYKWRFVGIIESDRATSLYEDLVVEFRTGGSTQTVQATIIRKIRQSDGTSIFIFECDTLTPEFASRRVSQFSIVLDSFRGIRIPTSAVHINDGEQGVYVQNGAELVFKKINVILTESDYYLVEDTTAEKDFISLYDSVVISGRDLYDGKIIQ